MSQRLRRYRSHRELNRCGGFEGGTFRSQWYQGLGDGMEWLRLSLDGARKAEVRVWAADRPEDAPSEPVLTRTGDDLILYGVRGRFLRFTVSPGEGLRGYELAFPALSIDEGLPAVMQGDEGLRRFLGVYQSLSMDLGRAFAQFSRRLDPREPEALPTLYRWLGADWALEAPEGLRERLLADASRLNRLRGTRRGLELLLEIAAGGRGRIVEGFQRRSLPLSAGERADCERLYPTDVTLLLPRSLPQRTVHFLEGVLEKFVPAGVSFSVRLLEPGAVLDDLCFLDGNARLTEPAPPALDESCLENLTLE